MFIHHILVFSSFKRREKGRRRGERRGGGGGGGGGRNFQLHIIYGMERRAYLSYFFILHDSYL